MDDPLPGSILVFLIFLLIHAAYSMAEVSIIGLDNHRLDKLAKQGDRRALRIQSILKKPSIFTPALRLGGLICDALALLVVTRVFVDRLLRAFLALNSQETFDGWSPFIVWAAFLFVEILLQQIFAEALARRVALRFSENLTYALSILYRVMFSLAAPVVRLAEAVASLLSKLFRLDNLDMRTTATEEEIRQLVNIGQEKGLIEEEEGEMIDNIFDFNNKVAADVMTHRTDIEALRIDADMDELRRVIRESGISRFPVYCEDIDDIRGILHIRDFYENLMAEHPLPLEKIIREAHKVPESVRTDILFRDLQRINEHMAIVIDEYGGTSGVVTIEDLLEEIVGDIFDEHDEVERDYEKIDERRYRLRGNVRLEDIEELFDLHIETDEFDTLAGMIYFKLAHVPEDGARPELTAYGLRIQVEKIVDHRIESAIVCRCPGGDAAAHPIA